MYCSILGKALMLMSSDYGFRMRILKRVIWNESCEDAKPLQQYVLIIVINGCMLQATTYLSDQSLDLEFDACNSHPES